VLAESGRDPHHETMSRTGPRRGWHPPKSSFRPPALGLFAAGGVAAALANFVPAYVAALLGFGSGVAGYMGQRAWERRIESGSLKQRWEDALETAPPADPIAASESILNSLTPEVRAVHFNLAATQYQRALMRWCLEDEDPSRVILVTGRAGAGKTRTVLELSEELAGRGWDYGWVRPGKGAAAVDVASGWKRPVLLLVDDCQTRSDLKDTLASIARIQSGKVRVLLLARESGPWWNRMRSGLDVDTVAQIELWHTVEIKAIALSEHAQKQMFAQATREFARHFDREVPSVVVAAQIPAPSTLLIHAAAAVAVRAPLDGEVQIDDAVEKLFELEGRYWMSSSREKAAGKFSINDIRAAVALSVLIGANSLEDSTRRLRALPHFSGMARDDLEIFANWLRELYPQFGDDWLSPRLPGRLAERFAAMQLVTSQNFAAAVVAAAMPDRTERLVLTLLRATKHTVAAREAVAVVLAPAPVSLLRMAISLTCDIAAPIDSELAKVVEKRVLTETEIDSLLEVLPANPINGGICSKLGFSPVFGARLTGEIALPRTRAAVTRQRLANATEPMTKARLLDDLREGLCAVVQVEQALATAYKAVDAWRLAVDEDCRDSSSTALAGLAASLSHLGDVQIQAYFQRGAGSTDSNSLISMGIHSMESAIKLWRALEQKDPTSHRASLARALEAVGAASNVPGVDALRESVDLWRRLAKSDQSHRGDLATALDYFALRNQNRPEADRMRQEAFELWEDLATEGSSQAGIGWAKALIERGRLDEAREFLEQAAAVVGNVPALVELVSVLIRLGHSAAGIHLLRRTIDELDYFDYVLCQRYIDLCVEHGRIEEAEEGCAIGAQHQPQFADQLRQLRLPVQDRDMSPEAAQWFRSNRLMG
jgi:tetratricopeptide (TPR) repeat protein